MKSGGENGVNNINHIRGKFCADVGGPKSTKRCQNTLVAKDPCPDKAPDQKEACYVAYDSFLNETMPVLSGTPDQRRQTSRRIERGEFDEAINAIKAKDHKAATPKPGAGTGGPAELSAGAKAEVEKIRALCQRDGTQGQCSERLDSALKQLEAQYGDNKAELSRVIEHDMQNFSSPINLTDASGNPVAAANMAAVKQIIGRVVGVLVVSGAAAKATADELEGLCSEPIMTEPGNSACVNDVRDIQKQILDKSAGKQEVVEQILSNPAAEYKGLVYKLTVDGKEQTFKTLAEVMASLRRTYGVESWSFRVGLYGGIKMGATDGADSEIQSASDNIHGQPNVHLSARKNLRLRRDSWWSLGGDFNFSRIKLEGESVPEQAGRPWMFSFGFAAEYNHAFHHQWNLLVGGAALLSVATDKYLHSTEGGLMENYVHLDLQGTLAGRYRINQGNAIVCGAKLSMGTSIVQRDLESFGGEDPDIEPRRDYIRYGPAVGGFCQYEF